MTLGSYLVGLTTLTASIVFLLQPTSVPEDSPSWWESFSEWVLHSHPAPSYSKLPLFGLIPDVILHAQHSLYGEGFHRRYKLQVAVEGETAGCTLTAEWSMPKDVFIDQWLLHRKTAEVWDVNGTIDLEAPAYSESASSFTLSASRPAAPLITMDIPDLILRYQQPSNLYAKSPKIFLNPPKLGFKCERELVVKVEEVDKSFRTLNFNVPVANPNPLVGQFTTVTVVLSLFYILFQLYKA
jgi:hypothetical protein